MGILAILGKKKSEKLGEGELLQFKKKY